MADTQKELENLRNIITKIIYSNETWATLKDVCLSLGLSSVEDPQGLGKEKYLYKVTRDTSDDSIIKATQLILNSYPSDRGQPSESELQDLQDSLWWVESEGKQYISNVTRIRIVECLDGIAFWGRFGLQNFINAILPNADSLSLPDIGPDGDLYISLNNLVFGSLVSKQKSINMKPQRISILDWLQNIGLTKWPDKRFCLFIEHILHPEIQPQEMQSKLVEKFNKLLNQEGFRIIQESQQGGLPVYKVQRDYLGVTGSPKYIIFGSSGPKPDIVISDAVNMDIRIVNDANLCLIYDQPPTNDDLTWRMLLEWWGEKECVDTSLSKIRQEFGSRLMASLQSDPERILFETYFKEFTSRLGVKLPALIPQVYLHYDPRNKAERDKPVLVRQRMDFLLLLRNATRIVIEIDGKQHYANDDGSASPSRYAEMVLEDRRMKLLGYDIYRFGGAEFSDKKEARKMIITFFNDLFTRHGIIYRVNSLQ